MVVVVMMMMMILMGIWKEYHFDPICTFSLSHALEQILT